MTLWHGTRVHSTFSSESTFSYLSWYFASYFVSVSLFRNPGEWALKYILPLKNFKYIKLLLMIYNPIWNNMFSSWNARSLVLKHLIFIDFYISAVVAKILDFWGYPRLLEYFKTRPRCLARRRYSYSHFKRSNFPEEEGVRFNIISIYDECSCILINLLILVN